jgi:hypothetical protein
MKMEEILTVSCVHCQVIIDQILKEFLRNDNPEHTIAFPTEKILEMVVEKLAGHLLPKGVAMARSTALKHIQELEENGYLKKVFTSRASKKRGITLMLDEGAIVIDYVKRLNRMPVELYDTGYFWDFVMTVRDWKKYLTIECNVCGNVLKSPLFKKKEIEVRRGNYVARETGILLWKCNKHFRKTVDTVVHALDLHSYLK